MAPPVLQVLASGPCPSGGLRPVLGQAAAHIFEVAKSVQQPFELLVLCLKPHHPIIPRWPKVEGVQGEMLGKMILGSPQLGILLDAQKRLLLGLDQGVQGVGISFCETMAHQHGKVVHVEQPAIPLRQALESLCMSKRIYI